MRTAFSSERGMTLVAVLMMMFIMTGLAAGLAMSSRTDLAMSTNDRGYAGARAAAEAGLNHGAVLVLGTGAGTSIASILRGPDGLIDADNPAAPVNADNGTLAHLIGGTGPWPVDAAEVRYTYDVRVFDDDDPSLFAEPLTNAELASMGENGSGLTDANNRYVIRASGFGPNGIRVNVQTMLLPASLPAMVLNGSLTISGNPKILGTDGSVHANQNLTITGKNTVVAKNATASGTYTKPAGWSPGGVGAGHAAQIAPPAVDAASYLEEADLILTATGLIVNRATKATVCNASSNKSACKSSYGWTFTSATAGWNMNHSKGLAATYYVQGPAIVSGSPGTTASPLRISIIATGSITVSGSPKLAPEATSGLLFVTNGDLRLSGRMIQQSPEGRILVREQIQISGNVTLKSQLLVQNATSVSTVVTANSISGNPTLTYNGTLAGTSYTVAGWREGS